MYKIENCASKIDEAEVQHYTSEEGNRLDQGSSISKGVFKSHYSIVWNRHSPLRATMGGIASICFRFHFQQTLQMHTQGCQGC